METRSKKKCKLSAEMEGDTSLNSAQEYYLPPEIMEIIIGYLEEDPKELMKYRLVNLYWASVVKSCIERKILSNLMRWNNGLKRVPDLPIFNLRTSGLVLRVEGCVEDFVEGSANCGRMSIYERLFSGYADLHAQQKLENPPEPFPLLSVVSKGSAFNARPAAVYTPLKFGDGGNPFPTGSLTIRKTPPICGMIYQKKMKRLNHILKVEQLLCNFGEHLTSFAFQDATVTFLELESIMKYLPTLKTFSISKITLRKGSKNLVGSQTSLFPTRLTNIQAVKEISPQIIQWLVDRCAHQLISLDVDASELMPFRQPPTPSGSSVPYQKLNYLKLYTPSRSFLQLTEVFPLKRLYLTNNEAQKMIHKISENDVNDFVVKFTNTMVEVNGHLKLYCDNCAWLRMELWVGQGSDGQHRKLSRAYRKNCRKC